MDSSVSGIFRCATLKELSLEPNFPIFMAGQRTTDFRFFTYRISGLRNHVDRIPAEAGIQGYCAQRPWP